jgi:cellulose synthase/poly-beta-1,6-N-acetylglucosamine synthase-like glycosyltransferase
MISIIIPARNEEKNLPELLESLKNQTYKKKFEIIVVDGKSNILMASLVNPQILNHVNLKELIEDLF